LNILLKQIERLVNLIVKIVMFFKLIIDYRMKRYQMTYQAWNTWNFNVTSWIKTSYSEFNYTFIM